MASYSLDGPKEIWIWNGLETCMIHVYEKEEAVFQSQKAEAQNESKSICRIVHGRLLHTMSLWLQLAVLKRSALTESKQEKKRK